MPYALSCAAPTVCGIVGKRGKVTLLLKHPDQPVQEANLRRITISSHISKVEATAFYALATAGPWGPVPRRGHAAGAPPRGGLPGVREARPSQALAPGGGRRDHRPRQVF